MEVNKQKLKQPAQLAQEILNSNQYVNDWERNFLQSIPLSLKNFGSLTYKQLRKLNNIAYHAGISVYQKPAELSTNQIIFLKFKDLREIAQQMSVTDQQTFRIQLREFKNYGKDAIDKKTVSMLHQKYYHKALGRPTIDEKKKLD